MRYLLDSNIISDFYDKFSTGYPLIFRKLSVLTDQDDVAISILTIYELEYGYANAPQEKKPILRQKIIEAQNDFEVLPLSPESAQIFGRLKKIFKEVRGLSQENVKKHNIDVMLASIAIVEQCILVSTDSIYKDMQGIQRGLQWENWLQ